MVGLLRPGVSVSPQGGAATDRHPRPGGGRVLSGARAALLGVVVLAPEAAAWQGLLGLARSVLGLSGGWEYLVPLLFGAAAFYVALLAQRYVLRGDSALTERALTWLYAVAGAAFNFWHASSVLGETASAFFFGGASLSAVLLWDRTLRAWRRDQLREIGALERPLPRFRVLRWVLAGPSTFRAFRAAVVYGVTSPDEALAVAAEVKSGGTDRGGDRVVADTDAGADVEEAASGVDVWRSSLAELAQVSGKAAAVREGWRMVGVGPGPSGRPTREQIAQVMGVFERAGIEVSEKYAREVRRRMKSSQSPETAQPVESLESLESVGASPVLRSVELVSAVNA